ncbi:MAG TPA: DUF58 domain-containing protein [Acidimicrobiales bacterium]|nr:DUF58 domain-containing protein [Acidimicrobiales bacterium]
MLTRQGWLVGLGAAALLVMGRVLGLVELFALGVVAAVLVVGSAVLVAAARLELEVGRAIHPARVHVGTSSRVDLTIRNLRAGGTPVLRLRDPVSGTRGADLLVPPLGRGERTVAAYRLPTDRRGLVQIGPLEVVVGDPFGLTNLATVAAPLVALTVYPHVDPIDPLPYTTGHDPLAGAKQPNSLGRTGEDFYALRPYVVGDDLRRIHWPSSARHDELLVRQNELPWQGRTTVLLDVRKAAHSGDSLEVAVSAAASIVAATARRHDLIRLMTTNGSDSDFAPGSDHVEAIMEHLAVVPASSTGSLRRAIEMLGRRSTGGALVVLVAEVPADDLRAAVHLRSRYGSLTIVHIDRSAWDPGADEGPPPVVPALRVTRDVPFATAWNAYVRNTTRRGRTAGGARR